MTVEKLNELMPILYLSSELSGIGWDSVSENDKGVLITKAESFISNLQFEKGAENIEGFESDKDNAECCIIFDLLQVGVEGNTRANLIKQGVKSITTAGVSESYGDYEEVKKNGFISSSYKAYLQKYLYYGV